MKKVFTLVLAMTIVVAGFAQIKSPKLSSKQMKTAQAVTLTGFEERDMANMPMNTRGIIAVSDEAVELSPTTYDWQSNMGPRNFTAVWPDGFAVMCYTQATDGSFSDRGTGLAIWDPAVGEWEFTESRVEGVKTGFGSIARYKENGLVIAAHTASDLRIFLVEDFRQGNRDFGQGIVLPVDTGVDPCWPVVQCSGENLDIVNVICTNSGATTPCTDPMIYYQYQNGEWTHQYETIPNLDGDHMTDGGSNICYFMLYDPEKPNRVSFILNNAWSDGKLVISEDNGNTWGERVFFQHPGINVDFGEEWFFYPRWTGAAFDANDNLHIVYEYNGSTGAPGSGSYYPAIGGIAYWSELLPKSELCIGGIGNVGEPFIMDTTYLIQDIYESEYYWSDANHDPLPEYIGELEIVDDNFDVLPRDATEGFRPAQDNWGDHGGYNGGKAAFASMYYDKATDRVFSFWSMICGDKDANLGWDATNGQYYLRVFCNGSADGGRTWKGTKSVFGYNEHITLALSEMTYGQVIPYLYRDAEGEYLWYCFQVDTNTGTFVQSEDPDAEDNLYNAIKVYVSYFDPTLGVEEESAVANVNMTVFPNPANGSFTMELSEEADVNIINAVGQQVKSYKSVKSVLVNDLSAGIYFVKAGNQTQKVVVF